MNKIKVGLYTRVSTQEQAADGYSIGEQKDRLTKYAEAQNWSVYKIYNDPGFSGGKMDRPGLQQMIQDIKNNKIKKVVVYKLDRLSRSQKDTLYLIEDVFKKNNVDFVSMTENFDTGTPLGVAMIGILSVFAQLEREQIKERMQVGLDARAKAGYFHGGGFDPIGYDYIDGELKINDYEAMQVKKVYDMYLTDTAISYIARYMSEHYKIKYGSWTDSAVKSVLTTPIYTGKILWKNNIYEGRHQAIIDQDTFDKAQKLIKERSGRYRSQPFKRTSLLGGLLWCGNCGARYFCKQNTLKKAVKHRDPDAKPQKYYTCYSRAKSKKHMIKDPNCKNKSWNVKELDKIILDQIKKLALDPEYFKQIQENSNININNKNHKVIENRIKAIEKQIDKLIDLYQIDNIDFNVINNKINKLSDEKMNLEAELNNSQIIEPDLSIKQTKKVLKKFTDIINLADDEQIKQLVHTLIDAIIIFDDDIEIHWRFC